MKDVMMPKVNSIPSCLADFSKASASPAQAEAAPAINEGIRQVHTSAAMLGLAISMGAVGMLLPDQSAQAYTTTALKSSQLDLIASPKWHSIRKEMSPVEQIEIAQSSRGILQQNFELASPFVEPTVEAEETLWSLSQQQATAKAIASSHPILKELELSTDRVKLNPILTSQLNPVLSQSDAPLLRQQALDNLRQQRNQLATSLIELREEPQLASFQADASVNSEPEPILMQLDLDTKVIQAEASIPAAPTQLDLSDKTTEAELAPPLHLPLPEVITTSEQQVYQVQPGDTLAEIAERYSISRSSLIKTNKISNPDVIRVDQQLFIPISEAESSPKTATLPSVSSSKDLVSSAALKSSNGKRVTLNSAQAPLQAQAEIPLAMPASGKTEVSQSRLETTQYRYRHPSTLYADSLKADVTRLQQEYRQDAQADPEPAAAIQVGYQPTQPQVDRQAPPLRRATAAAPIEGENYYTRLQPLEGQIIEPDLPPLSSPEQYLPDSPTQFDGYIWPAKGVLTSGYGRRWGRMHRGIDIAGPIGTPIVAVAPGEVVSAGWNSGGFGNLVKLKHPDGSLTLYAHNSRILVHQGQEVEQGQFIAEMGSSGYSTGPHLHFEVHPNGQAAVNPIAYLPSAER